MRLHKSDQIEILYTIRLVEFALGLLKKHAKDASFTYTKAYTNNFKSLVLKTVKNMMLHGLTFFF